MLLCKRVGTVQFCSQDKVGETGASPPTGRVRHLALTSLQLFFLVIPEILHCCTFTNALQTEIRGLQVKNRNIRGRKRIFWS